MLALRILYQDENLVAVDKPAGFQVHSPEDPLHRVSDHRNCLVILRNQLGRYVYPVHRLDRATSGVLLFGLDSETAGQLGQQFARRETDKVYYAVTRGWVDDQGLIDQVLTNEQRGEQEARTRYHCLARVELPHPVGKRHPSSRYSLVRVVPETGRMHQIRRHFTRISHPLVGDTVYGDGPHNRLYRATLNIPGLLLKAHLLRFEHPRTRVPMRLISRWDKRWHRVFELFGACPFEATAISGSEV